GTVAKIVGDALHVLFGAPGEQPDHADRAVACALAVDDYAQSFRERCHKKGIALGITRIGVHAGPAMVGNFGGIRFFDYTAYGDTTNVGARLETANKQLGTRICVSAMLAEAVKNFLGLQGGGKISRGGRLVICCSGGERRPRGPSNPLRPNNLLIPPRRVIWTRLPSWKQAILALLPLSRHISEGNQRISLQASTSSAF